MNYFGIFYISNPPGKAKCDNTTWQQLYDLTTITNVTHAITLHTIYKSTETMMYNIWQHILHTTSLAKMRGLIAVVIHFSNIKSFSVFHLQKMGLSNVVRSSVQVWTKISRALKINYSILCNTATTFEIGSRFHIKWDI